MFIRAANLIMHFYFSWKILGSKKQTKPLRYKEKSKKLVIKFRFVGDVFNLTLFFIFVTSHTKKYTNGYPFEWQNAQLVNGWQTDGQAVWNGYHEQLNGWRKILNGSKWTAEQNFWTAQSEWLKVNGSKWMAQSERLNGCGKILNSWQWTVNGWQWTANGCGKILNGWQWTAKRLHKILEWIAKVQRTNFILGRRNHRCLYKLKHNTRHKLNLHT